MTRRVRAPEAPAPTSFDPMLLVGLTGGIGSGKSTVARILGEHGAVILDADVFARDAVRGGTDAFAAVVDRFGDGPRGSRRGARPAEARLDRVRGSRGAGGSRGHRPPRGSAHDRRRHPGRARHRPRGGAREPAADRDGGASGLRRGRRDLDRARDPGGANGGTWDGRGRRSRAARRATADRRARTRRPTCCWTTRARSRISNARSRSCGRRSPPARRGLSPRIIQRMPVRAILFDAGETLVHPSPSFPELFTRVLADAGHRRDPDAVLEASRSVFHRFSEAARDNELWTTSQERSERFWKGVYARCSTELDLGRDDGPARRPCTRRSPTRPTTRCSTTCWTPSPRSRPTGSRSASCRTSKRGSRISSASLGVRDRFPVRVISGLEGVEKPDARIFALALERIGADAADVVYVGDNPEFDVEPARARRDAARADRPTRTVPRRGLHPDRRISAICRRRWPPHDDDAPVHPRRRQRRARRAPRAAARGCARLAKA